MMRTWLAIAAALAVMAVPARAEPVPMTAAAWDAEGVFEFAEKDGRQAIRLGPGAGAPLKSGGATLRGVEFATGVIEFDMLASGGRDFAGISFRGDASGNAELFYIRPHMNGRPDSTQYTPVVNGNLAWQIFSGDGFTSQQDFNIGKWMHVRIDVYQTSALVTVDGKPALVVPHLKSSRRTGGMGLTAVGGTWFANFSYQPIADYRDPVPPVPLPAIAPGTVPVWQVTPAMAEADALALAAKGDWQAAQWQPIAVESHGIANLSLAGPDTPERTSFVARFSLASDGDRTVKMAFGFSDNVQIYVNGQPLYAGSDVQASRDYRFLGIVGWWDTLFLPLRRGRNDVVFVVSDGSNGGTAAAARIEPAPGVTIEPVMPESAR